MQLEEFTVKATENGITLEQRKTDDNSLHLILILILWSNAVGSVYWWQLTSPYFNTDEPPYQSIGEVEEGGCEPMVPTVFGMWVPVDDVIALTKEVNVGQFWRASTWAAQQQRKAEENKIQLSSGLGSGIMLTPGQSGSEREKETE